jgi:hypothetical protein
MSDPSSPSSAASYAAALQVTDEELLTRYDKTPTENRGDFLRALPTEKKQVILNALAARLAQGGQQQQSAVVTQYPPPKMGYAYVSGSGGNGGDEFDDYEEDMDENDVEDEFDEDMMAHFEDHMMAALPSASAFTGGIDLAALANPENGVVLATDLTARRKEVGDFELMRIAKMGDLISFQEFEPHLQTSVNTFFDNNGRDALHYAVDGGSLELVRYLVEEKRMSLRLDEKLKATALDMAVLLGREELAKYLTSQFPRDPKKYEDALTTFAPAPPRFCISKSAPTVQPPQRERLFWSAAPIIKAATAGFRFQAEVLPISDTSGNPVFETFVAVANRPVCGNHHGLDMWTMPVDRAILTAIVGASSADAAAVTVIGVTAHKDGSVAPAGVCLAIGGVKPDAEDGPIKFVIKQGSAPPTTLICAFAASFSVVPLHQGHGVNALMMENLKTTLRTSNRTASSIATVFRCKERLPPLPVALVKWFRRSLRPLNMLSSNYLLAATEVYPDFYSYDDRLRVDWVAKETPLPSQRTTATLVSWQEPSDEDDLVVKCIIALLEKVTAADATFVVLFSETASAIRQTLLNPGLRTFVIWSADHQSITDVICIRLRESREQAESGLRLRCASLVFAAFTTIAGEKKALELVAVAAQLDCDTLFVPNTCGFTDADFSKAMFEEADNCREYLYAVTDSSDGAPRSIVTGTAMLPAGKVYVPLGLI